jgi:hypothetical protein
MTSQASMVAMDAVAASRAAIDVCRSTFASAERLWPEGADWVGPVTLRGPVALRSPPRRPPGSVVVVVGGGLVPLAGDGLGLLVVEGGLVAEVVVGGDVVVGGGGLVGVLE